MFRVPSTLTALTAFLALTVTPAHATTCPMLLDPVGDGRWATAPVITSDKLDILSADVTSGPTTVVAVLRLGSFAPDLVDRLGVAWAVAWSIDGTRYAVRLRQGAVTGGSYISTFEGPAGTAPATYAIDVAGATITWTVPRSALPVLATPGKVFTALTAFSTVLSSSADSAFSTATYTDQDPGCVPAS